MAEDQHEAIGQPRKHRPSSPHTMHPFKINPDNGFITIGSSGVIAPRLTKNDFFNAFHAFPIQALGFDRFMLCGAVLGQEPMQLLLRFESDVLMPRLDFGVKLSNAIYGPDGWPDDSVMIKELAHVKTLLGAQLGRAFDKGVEYFHWGCAWAHYLERDSSAHFGIGYEKAFSPN